MMSYPKPGIRELRQFGLLMGGLLMLFFGLLIPWLWSFSYPQWPWIVGGVFIVWGLTLPRSLGPVYRLWMWIGGIFGWINTRILLGFVFYFIVLPTGLLVRLFGKDPMARSFDPNAASYRVKSTPPARENMEKPF
jgi:hypothetical protein